MSWHYLQGPEVAYWDPNCSDGIPNALLKLNPMLGTSCSQDRETECLNHSPSGMTSRHSTEGLGEVESMLCLEDSPVKTSVRQDLETRNQGDLQGHVADFGLKCSGLLKKCNLCMSSWKTARTCVPTALAPLSKDLPAWGMTCGGACWELGTSVRHINETECGSPREKFPTPTAMRGLEGGSGSRHSYMRWGKPKDSDCGPLNPQLTEWLMGWPIGWTALEPLEMGKFHKWLRLHGLSCRKGGE